jgi:hypothetical protein
VQVTQLGWNVSRTVRPLATGVQQTVCWIPRTVNALKPISVTMVGLPAAADLAELLTVCQTPV